MSGSHPAASGDSHWLSNRPTDGTWSQHGGRGKQDKTRDILVILSEIPTRDDKYPRALAWQRSYN